MTRKFDEVVSQTDHVKENQEDLAPCVAQPSQTSTASKWKKIPMELSASITNCIVLNLCFADTEYS